MLWLWAISQAEFRTVLESCFTAEYQREWTELIPLSFSRAHSPRHGRQEIDKGIGPEEKGRKSPEKELRRERRAHIHLSEHTHIYTQKHERKCVGASVCVLSALLLVNGICLRLNCQSDCDWWLKGLAPPRQTASLTKCYKNNKIQSRLGRERAGERVLIGQDTDKHRGQNDISMITLQPIHNTKRCNGMQQSNAR